MFPGLARHPIGFNLSTFSTPDQAIPEPDLWNHAGGARKESRQNGQLGCLGNHCLLGIIMHHVSSYFGHKMPSNHNFNSNG